ncbi:hypothetical protein [Pseudomonas sp. RIT-PI-S]|uniref:hypothetical protein n=1 Tax=Pseudomonas sp. RIT-PI-S TaxID=3035295 RepID=UPI0021D890B5|nr:hypothetical protein [Pseudomonas sp. RIT-PI-S]
MNLHKVPSIKTGFSIEVHGFEKAESYLHMIEWLGRGKNINTFLTQDSEKELYLQDEGSRLLSAELLEVSEVESKAVQQGHTDQGILKEFKINFLMRFHIISSTKETWELKVGQRYLSGNLDVPEKSYLQMSFDVIEARQI